MLWLVLEACCFVSRDIVLFASSLLKFIFDFLLDISVNYFAPEKLVCSQSWASRVPGSWWMIWSILWLCSRSRRNLLILRGPHAWVGGVHDSAISDRCLRFYAGSLYGWVLRLACSKKLYTRAFWASTVTSPLLYVQLLVPQWMMKCVMYCGAAAIKCQMSWHRMYGACSPPCMVHVPCTRTGCRQLKLCVLSRDIQKCSTRNWPGTGFDAASLKQVCAFMLPWHCLKQRIRNVFVLHWWQWQVMFKSSRVSEYGGNHILSSSIRGNGRQRGKTGS